MSNLDIAFHDSVLAEIDSFVAAHPPERGGALMGPVGQPVVSQFLPDPHASVTGITFTPSQQLRDLVAHTERTRSDLELKGIVHSHPSSMDHPSGGDHRAFADSLRKAPWLGRFVCPIVTARVFGDDDRHRLALDAGVMSVFVAESRVGGAVQVEPGRPRVIPFQRDVAVLATRLGTAVESTGTHVEVGGTLHAAAVLRDEAADVMALFPPLYPTAPPLVLLSRRAAAAATSPAARLAALLAGDQTPSTTVAVPLAWSMNVADTDRLAAALDSALGRVLDAEPDPFGPRSPSAAAGAVPTETRAPSSSSDEQVARDGLRARLDGAVPASLRAAKVLVVGLGSGGSQTAEALARASVENFVLVDPDVVAPENLSRSVYELADVGKAKTAALATRLAAINPAVATRTVDAALDDIADDELIPLVRDADLVIAATDDPKAQLRLNHLAWTQGVPAVFGAVYARGHAGEVIFTFPGLEGMHCYRCATGNRRGGDRGDAGVNYGTGQLLAEPALGADISHVVTASVKIALGILELRGTGAAEHSAGQVVATALANRYQYLILSTVASYGFFPQVMGNAAGQHAYQSVWLSAQENPDCPTCGAKPLTAGAFVTSGPNLAALRPVGAEDAGDDLEDRPSRRDAAPPRPVPDPAASPPNAAPGARVAAEPTGAPADRHSDTSAGAQDTQRSVHEATGAIAGPVTTDAG